MGAKRGAMIGAGLGLAIACLAEIVIAYASRRTGSPFAINLPFALSIVLPFAALGFIVARVRRRRI